jgi:hypothetical protein
MLAKHFSKKENPTALADQVREKHLLGYHDVRVGNLPDERLIKFISTNLPDLLPQARRSFDQFKDLLCAYGNVRSATNHFG